MKNFKFNKLVYFFKIVIRVCFWYFFKKYVIEYYVVCFFSKFEWFIDYELKIVGKLYVCIYFMLFW